MGLKKCPKCELNYIRDDAKYCEVCSRKHKISDEDDNEDLLCIECGEHRAMKGKDICSYCYKEKLRQEQLEARHKAAAAAIDIDEVELNDVEVPIGDDDIPEAEIHDIEDEFGDEPEPEVEEEESDPLEDEFDSEDYE